MTPWSLAKVWALHAVSETKGLALNHVDVAKMGEFMASEGFAAVSKVLAVRTALSCCSAGPARRYR